MKILIDYFGNICKKTDLSVYSQEQLDMIAEELNERPRKTLNFLRGA